MDNQTAHFQIPVRLAGRAAARILNGPAEGRVAALFNSSFYIEMEDGLICVGHEDFEPSPLNLVTLAPARTRWPASGLRLDDKVSVSADVVRVGHRFSFHLSDTRTWSPEPFPGWNSSDLERGIRRFQDLSASCAGHDGLGAFLVPGFHPGPDNVLCVAAMRPITALQHWLKTAIQNRDKNIRLDGRALQPLIGLGPGLTPSGDDFIGGMMIALHALGETKICRQLWERVRPGVEDAGNPISCAHLKAASGGEGSAGIHRALSSILTGCPEERQNCLSSIERIGHTSGWDIMAGAVTAFDAFIETRPLQVSS